MSRPATPRHGHAPVPLRLVADEDAIERLGDFCWEQGADSVPTHVWLAIPSPTCGGWTPIRIAVNRGPNLPGKAWGWDGNADKPTLTPSVHTYGHWHGWVRGGQLVEA